MDLCLDFVLLTYTYILGCCEKSWRLLSCLLQLGQITSWFQAFFLAVDKWNAFPPVATKSSCFKPNDQAADAFLRSCLELSHWMSPGVMAFHSMREGFLKSLVSKCCKLSVLWNRKQENLTKKHKNSYCKRCKVIQLVIVVSPFFCGMNSLKRFNLVARLFLGNPPTSDCRLDKKWRFLWIY